MEEVWGVSMVRDEADVIGYTLAHLAEEGFHGLIIADNGSVDGTRDILADAKLDIPVIVKDDPEVGYYQSRKMTALAAEAAERGAGWIVPFDADEVWFCRGSRLAEEIQTYGQTWDVIPFALWNHFGSGLDPEDDPNPFTRMQYRHPDRGQMPKVAVRWRDDLVIEQGNHGAHYRNGGSRQMGAGSFFELRHFPYRSLEQFIRKARNGAEAYNATDLPTSAGAHWREYGALLERYGPGAIQEIYERWFWFKAPVTSGLSFDPAPYRRWTR